MLYRGDMPSSHDDRVLEVGKALAVLGGDVHIDLPHEYAGRHRFSAKAVLPDEPSLMLAALVPTQAVFTKMPVLANEHWSEPDVVLEREGLRYVVDVCDENDTFTGIARKVEAIIFCARRWRVAGLAMVTKGPQKPFQGKLAELEALRTTFWKLVGAEPAARPDSTVPYLDALTKLPAIAAIYGKPQWECVLEVHSADAGWEERLVAHARDAFAARRPMVT
jgi:hypothetical protein